MPRINSIVAAIALALGLAGPSLAADPLKWDEIAAKARGQSVFFNAWGGAPQTNAFIAMIGDEAMKRYGVRVEQVKLTDTAEAVTRVIAEKTAGRNEGGSVDLIWINGPNFLAMKSQGLLFGPVTDVLPNYRFVDTAKRRSNLIDFTVPVDGMEIPWRVAQIVFVHDSVRAPLATLPKSAPAMLDWARSHPGRLTHPNVRNFLGATFLKQALVDLAADPSLLQQPASDQNFAAVTAPLWAWYDALKPLLWHGGKQFPDNGTALLQLLADGEIDIAISFDPAEAAVGIASGTLPKSTRVFVFDKGTIGNTSFVAIPYNAAHKEGAMLVANLLLDPAIQAQAQSPRSIGAFTVLDLDKLDAAQRKLFDPPQDAVGLPSNADLKASLLEPHASWMTRITAEWEKRYVK